jgi:hypothetical protein
VFRFRARVANRRSDHLETCPHCGRDRAYRMHLAWRCDEVDAFASALELDLIEAGDFAG